MSEISKWLIDKGMEWGIEQGIEQGMEKGIEQGEMNKSKTFALKMYQNGFRPDYIAGILDTSVQQVEEWLGLTLA